MHPALQDQALPKKAGSFWATSCGAYLCAKAISPGGCHI